MAYRPLPYARRTATVSEVLRLNSFDLDRIRTNYTYSNKTREETANAISRFPTLEAAVREGLAEAGHIGSTVRLCLEGDVPIKHRDKHYGIPMVFVLPRKFPHDPPTCLVRPTGAGAASAPTEGGHVCLCVDQNGRITFPYLEDWNYRTSNLTTLIEVVRAHFGERPPVTDEVLGNLEIKKGSPKGLPSPQPLKRTRYTSLPSGLYGIGDIFEEAAEEVNKKETEQEENDTTFKGKENETTTEAENAKEKVLPETEPDQAQQNHETARKPDEKGLSNTKKSADDKDEIKTSEDVTTPLLANVETQAPTQNEKDFQTKKGNGKEQRGRTDQKGSESAKQGRREAKMPDTFRDEDYMEEESGGCFPRKRSARRLKSPTPSKHSSTREKMVRHKDLKKLSCNLGQEWEQLAIRLGSTHADVDRYKKNERKTQRQAFSMLDQWRERAGNSATREKLCKVLQEEDVDVDKFAFLL